MLWKRFEIKSHQRRAHYLNWPRNGRRLTAGGGLPEPPSVWLGLSVGNLQSRPDSAVVLYFFCMSEVPRLSPAEDSDGFLHSFFWVLELFMADGASSLVKNIYFSAPFSSNGTYISKFSIIFWFGLARWQVTESYRTQFNCKF